MRKGVHAQFANLNEFKAFIAEQKRMEAVEAANVAAAANKRDVEAAQRLMRAKSLPKPKNGPRTIQVTA